MSVEEYRQYWPHIIGIVDEFRRNPELSLDENIFSSKLAGAFYAGVVEFINNEINRPPPNWVYKDEYYLKKPWFANNYKSAKLRIFIMLETPIEFKTRNIYIGANTFDRC